MSLRETPMLALGFADYATKVNILITVIKTAGVLILLPRMGYLGSPMMLSMSNILGSSLSVLKVRAEIASREEADTDQIEG